MKKLTVTAVLVCVILVNGCAYDGGRVTDGTNLAIGIIIPGTQWKVNIADYVGGCRVAGGRQTRIVVTNEVSETNRYFGIVETRRKTKMTASVEPKEMPERPPSSIPAK